MIETTKPCPECESRDSDCIVSFGGKRWSWFRRPAHVSVCCFWCGYEGPSIAIQQDESYHQTSTQKRLWGFDKPTTCGLSTIYRAIEGWNACR